MSPDCPPKQRNIAQIFQFPVIYDTMTVFQNLAFPLKNRGRTKEEIEPRVIELAKMLGLEKDLHTKAQHLTADAKQKISLGRGLIRTSVNAILFDEPLTVIDPAAEMGTALAAQIPAQEVRLHHDLCHP